MAYLLPPLPREALAADWKGLAALAACMALAGASGSEQSNCYGVRLRGYGRARSEAGQF